MNTYFMSLAIEEAEKGRGWTNPNPNVGAILVKDKKIIGRGFHSEYGKLHAEREALKDSLQKGFSAEGATMYITLEPCAHSGKTPPCTEAIIDAKIERVVIGSTDPNPKVSGEGVKQLEGAGIKVQTGILKEECDQLNPHFFHHIITGRPYVAMKYAMSQDGKIATYTKDSKWITGNKARTHVHKLRHEYMGIMVGVNTVIVDNPSLNTRLEQKTRTPIRIICDSQLRTPVNSKIVQTAKKIPTILATTTTDEKEHQVFLDQGCEVLVTEEENKKVHLKQLMDKLGEKDIDSVLLEGGSVLNAAMLEEKLVSKVYTYISPKIIGGREAPSPISGKGSERIKDVSMLQTKKISQLGNDMLIESEVYECSQEL